MIENEWGKEEFEVIFFEFFGFGFMKLCFLVYLIIWIDGGKDIIVLYV